VESEENASSRQYHSEQQTISFVSGYGGTEFRDNWRSYLQFVPPCVGNYVISIERENEFKRVKAMFADSFMRGSVVPQLLLRSQDTSSKFALVDKRIWKFFVDYEVHSPIIAFMDDDSCFTRTVTREDIVQGGRVIARGINTPEMLNFGKVASVVRYLWNDKRKPIAGFMTDFPVTVWRDMLPDLRRFVVQHEFPQAKTIGMTRQREKELFTAAFDKLVAAMEKVWTHTWMFDEFSLLMHFAYFSPKWKDRYMWNLAPHDINTGSISQPIPAFSIHQTFGAKNGHCVFQCPQRNATLPENIAMYPANYGVYYNGSYIKATCKEDGGTAECSLLRLVGDERDSNSAIAKYYEQGPAALLQQHTKQTSDLVKECKALSHADQDDTLISKWARVWPH
jgi:hypothetical protein